MPRNYVICTKWITSNAISLGSLTPFLLCSWWLLCPRPRRNCLHHETATCISTTLQAPLSILLTLLTNQAKSFNIGHCCGRESRSGDTHNIPYSISGFSPISSSLLISFYHSLFIEQVFIEELLYAWHTLLMLRIQQWVQPSISLPS